MTISSNTRKNGPYIGNGSAATFAFTFKVFQASDLEVVKLDTTTNVETVLTLTTDYTVTLNADQDSNPGGSITLVAGALPVNRNLVITSDLEALQPTDLTNQGGFYPEVITDALDRLTILIQQLTDGVQRSIKVSTTNTINNSEFSIPPAERANKYLSFDSNGDLLVTQSVGIPRGTWTTGTAYSSRDIVVDPANYNVYIALVSHTSSGTAPLKNNPQISNWSLLVDAEAAGISASSAAASAASASASAATSNTNASLAGQARDNAIAAQNAAQASQSAAGLSAADASADAAIAAAEAVAAAISAAAAEAAAESAIASAGGGAAKVSALDTNANYLEFKFEAGTDVQITKVNPGADEKLRISAPYAVAYAIALGG
ncbi:tail fiber protein [Caudoviricetes sp.]|nr:tail fiber protein [Caudoviricetes sp.]